MCLTNCFTPSQANTIKEIRWLNVVTYCWLTATCTAVTISSKLVTVFAAIILSVYFIDVIYKASYVGQSIYFNPTDKSLIGGLFLKLEETAISGHDLQLGDKTISKWDHDKIYVDNDDKLWTFFYSIWIDLTAYYTAEINTTTASQSALVGLYQNNNQSCQRNLMWC